MSKYIQIKKAELIPDKYGKHISITMVGLYDENGKWIKWVPLNEKLLDYLKNKKIEL